MPADTQPLVSRVFDRGVLVVAAALTLVTVVVGVAQSGGFQLEPSLWLAAPLIAAFARYPLHLDRPSGAIEMGVDSCVLAYLATITERPYQGLLVWAAGAVLAQYVTGKRPAARIFNIGVMVSCGAVALWVVELLVERLEASTGSIQQFVAVMTGCTIYFLLDIAVSEISVALESGAPLLPQQLRDSGALQTMAGFVAVDSLGFLAATVETFMDDWMLLLLGVPLITLLVAAEASGRARESARRTRVLFDVSRSVQAQPSPDEVLRRLGPGAVDLIRVPQTRLRSEPPQAGEVGARVSDGTREWWLVAPEWSRPRATIDSDAEHLDQLALAGSEALSRLKLTREMTYLARHDTLTQLANRSVFLDRVEHALQLARRRHSRVAVLFCDLDGFKQVNDRFGHGAGDAVLVTIAGRIRSRVRASDTVARLGGDEFAVLLEDVEDETDVDRVADDLLSAVVERVEVTGHFVSVSTSIGIATAEGSDTGEGVLRSADIAMYEAKAQGKNCVARYQPEHGSARVRKLEMVEALRSAVDAGELTVVYQPVLEVHSGTVVGLEALARWRYGERDISPAQFVPLAEETGLVVPLGEHVLDVVAADARSLDGLEGLHGLALDVAVNISAQQLRSPAFVDRVRAANESLDGVGLVLEVTERDVVREDSLSLDAMQRLVAEGVRFAVDDFGVGFSSIGYLQNLPVQVLKTDRSFAAAIDTSPRAAKLLRSMLLMGQALGLDVVVEGVERPGQLEQLKSLRRDVYAQGFLLGRPMTLDQALRVVAPAAPDLSAGRAAAAPNGAGRGRAAGVAGPVPRQVPSAWVAPPT